MSKLKIMQQGGGLSYSPFVPEMQGTTATSSTKSSSSDGESKIDALDKELIALMKSEDLLPSDINFITKRIVNFQKRASNLSATGDYSSAMPGMLQIIGAVKKAKYFKDQSDAAATQMTKENAGGEFALDSRGLMYVLNNKTGKLDKVSVDKFDSEEYSALSNSQLLFYRQTNLPNDTAIFNDIQNSVGIGSVIKEIDRIVKEYGTAENVKYLTKDKDAQQVILDANSPDGIYKITTEKPSGDIKTAWLSVYNQLAPNMQHLLNVRAKTSGSSIPEYIHDIITRNTSTKIDANYDTNVSKAAGFDVTSGGSGSGSGSTKTVKDTYAERLVSGNGISPPEWINIMTMGSGVTLRAYSQGAGYILKDKTKMPTASLHSVLTQADAIGAIVNSQSVTFGDSLIDPRDFKSLMVDNDVEMKRIWLPIKRTSDGRITPDFEAQKRLEQVQNYIEQNQGNIADAWIEDWLNQNLPNAVWDKEQGVVRFQQADMLPFLVMRGVAGSNRVDFNKDSEYLYHNDKQSGHKWQEEYDRIVTEVTNTDKSGKRSAKGSGRGKFYEGNIYIPILSPTAGSMVFNDQYFPQDVYTNITQKATNSEIKRQIKTNF